MESQYIKDAKPLKTAGDSLMEQFGQYVSHVKIRELFILAISVCMLS